VPEKDATMVDDLLAYSQRIAAFLQSAFDQDPEFMHRNKVPLASCCCSFWWMNARDPPGRSAPLQVAFETFINRRPNKPAEMIAKYMDAKLRAGFKVALCYSILCVLLCLEAWA
jgi:hypothetical protein